MKALRVVRPTAEEAAQACAQHIAARLRAAADISPAVSIALSGGSSPKLMFRFLAKESLPWSRIHVFWVDERCVPPDDEQSNYGMTRRELLEPARVPDSNVHRVMGELPPAEAAERYAADIAGFFHLRSGGLPRFDVIHRGMGPDGHTASLFPGETLIEDRSKTVAAVYVPKMNQWRVTLLPAALLAARHTVVFAPGADKAPNIRVALEGTYDPVRVPAQLGVHGPAEQAWFLDAAAAAQLGGRAVSSAVSPQPQRSLF